MACKALNLKGQPCQARPMQGEDFCYRHHPAKRAEAMEASTKGGENRKRLAGIPDDPMEIRDAEGAMLAVAKILDEVRSGRLDYKIGNALFTGLNVFKSLHESAVLERDLAQMKEMRAEMQKQWGKGEGGEVVETGQKAGKKGRAAKAGGAGA